MSTETKTVAITDILTDKQIDEVVRICNKTPDNQIVRELSKYLKQFEHDLDYKGIVYEYLAWVLYAHYNKIV